MTRGCSGIGCRQGRKPQSCDCALSEMDCDVGLDAARPFPAPPPLPDDVRSRLRRRALVLIPAGFALMASLLNCFGAAPFKELVP